MKLQSRSILDKNLRKRNLNEMKLQSWGILDKNLRKRNQNETKQNETSKLEHLGQKPEKEKLK